MTTFDGHQMMGKLQCQATAETGKRCRQICYSKSKYCYYHDKKSRGILGPWQWANNQGAGHNLTSDKVKEHNLWIRQHVSDVFAFYHC